MTLLSAGMPRMDNAREAADDEEAETGTTVFVKYNRLLHGEKRVTRHSKREKLTSKFLKKYIHYAKSRIMPVLTEEVYLSILSLTLALLNNHLHATYILICKMQIRVYFTFEVSGLA